MRRILITALLTLTVIGTACADDVPSGRVVEVLKSYGNSYLVEFPPNVKPELRDVFAVTHRGEPAGEVMVLSTGKRPGTFVVAPMASVKGALGVGDDCRFVRHAKVPAGGSVTQSVNTSGQTVDEMNRRGQRVRAAAAQEYLAEYALYEPAARQAVAALEDVLSTNVNFAGFVEKVRVAAAAVDIAQSQITQHLKDMYKSEHHDDGLPASCVNMSRAVSQYVQAARQWQRWINDASADPNSDKGISGYLGNAASLIQAARGNISGKQ